MRVSFYYKIIKNSYMHTTIGSFRRDCILVIFFQLYGSKAGLFEGNLFWVGQYDPLTFILEEELI